MSQSDRSTGPSRPVSASILADTVAFDASSDAIGVRCIHSRDVWTRVEGGALVSPAIDAPPIADDFVQYDFRGHLLLPGFIDAHVHYPQIGVIASCGEQLIDWLERYTFPAEAGFADPGLGRQTAEAFLRELLRCGTTSAMVYCTVHPESVDAFFGVSERFGTRMVAGKVLMDRHAPDALRDTAATGYSQSRRLIERWHGRGRQLYAITPRFAPTSSPAQLAEAGRLWTEFPGTFLQTHVAENRDEIAWVRRLFPEARSYLDVYRRFGLLGRRSVLGHGIHLDEEDFRVLSETGTTLAHCPTSNLFLGSGLFSMASARSPDRPVHVALATDIGGGTSLSMLQTMAECYKICQLQGYRLPVATAFWLATGGAARALGLDGMIGSLAPGAEADLVVLDPRATPLLEFRSGRCESIEELLFALMMLGDDRAVRATFINGHCAYDRDREPRFILPPPDRAPTGARS